MPYTFDDGRFLIGYDSCEPDYMLSDIVFDSKHCIRRYDNTNCMIDYIDTDIKNNIEPYKIHTDYYDWAKRSSEVATVDFCIMWASHYTDRLLKLIEEDPLQLERIISDEDFINSYQKLYSILSDALIRKHYAASGEGVNDSD